MRRSVFSAIMVLLIVPSLILPGYADKNRQERDSGGREWILKEWKDGTRPYPRDLGKREQSYRDRWGEKWFGPRMAQRIYSPGNWKWETYHVVPKDMAVRLKGRHIWGNSSNVMTFVWAPDGREVTDIYIKADSAFYHYDPLSKRSRFIGNPAKEGHVDGMMEAAQLNASRRDAALDHVTGRLFFSQRIGNKNILRFIEKLLPYKCSVTDKILYLPSVLEINKLHEKVRSPDDGKLEPLFENGKRSEAVFVVRTNNRVSIGHLPGANRGRRLLITPDGKGTYLARGKGAGEGWWLGTLYNMTGLFDIKTGKMISRLDVADTIPENFRGGDGPGTHGGNNVGFDGNLYTAQHGGAGGGSGRLFSINPENGRITMLYDSMPEDRPWRKMRSSFFDGPADSTWLWFTSTLWQTQCPRTGAIINGGWDNSGIRRYHDGFVTTVVGHYYGGFHEEPRPGWGRGFRNVHKSSNPSAAPNGDLFVADVNSVSGGKTIFTEPRIVRIYRTDWPEEQAVNGYAEQFMSKEKRELLMLDYAKQYIENFSQNNKLLKSRKY
jgi:hypothetical protein